MDIFVIFFGLSISGIGFLVTAYPDLISGYNTMTREQKENVNIKALSIFMRNVFIISGLSTIIGYFFFKLIGYNLISNIMVVTPIFVGAFIIMISSKKYDKNYVKPWKKYVQNGFIILTTIFVVYQITIGYLPHKTKITSNSFIISGKYGTEIMLNDIAEVNISHTIPQITAKTNGYSLNTVCKGYFRLKEYGKCRLFIKSTHGPFLIINDINGLRTIINNPDSSVTYSDYYGLHSLLEP